MRRPNASASSEGKAIASAVRGSRQSIVLTKKRARPADLPPKPDARMVQPNTNWKGRIGSETLVAVLSAHWKNWRKDFRRCQKKLSTNAVHNSRVASRRLLALLDMIESRLAADRSKKIRRALKAHLNSMDELRDAQVQLAAIQELPSGLEGVAEFREHLRSVVSARRREAGLGIQQTRLRRLAKWIKGGQRDLRRACKGRGQRPVQKALVRALSAAFRSVTTLRDRVNPREPGTIHRTRVALKKFRYMMEAFTKIVPAAASTRLDALREHQALMGAVEDAVVLLEALDRYIERKEAKLKQARALRTKLLRRRQTAIKAYLTRADEIQQFNPSEFKSAAR